MNNFSILQRIPSNHVYLCFRYLIYKEVLLNRKVFRTKHRNVTFSAAHFSVEESILWTCWEMVFIKSDCYPQQGWGILCTVEKERRNRKGERRGEEGRGAKERREEWRTRAGRGYKKRKKAK